MATTHQCRSLLVPATDADVQYISDRELVTGGPPVTDMLFRPLMITVSVVVEGDGRERSRSEEKGKSEWGDRKSVV